MSQLNEQQQKIHDACINWFLNSSEQVFQISGPAGSGKTFLIMEILKTLSLSSEKIMPMAYTGAATLVMRSRGFINAKTIHSSLYTLTRLPDMNNVDRRTGIPKLKTEFILRDNIDPRISLFFIDEGSFVPESMVKDILSFGRKVIVAGDLNQLPPVSEKPGFLYSGKVHMLSQIMRQNEGDPIVYLSQRAIKGLPINNGNYGSVIVLNDDEFLPNMIGYADVILCGTNRTRDDMNAQVRRIAKIDSILPLYGERMICRKNKFDIVNFEDIPLVNGLTGVVASNTSTLDPKNRKTFRMDFKPDCGYYNFNNLKVNYEYYISDADKRKYMKNNKYDNYNGEFFEFAYALTIHLSQGSEYNKGIIIEEYLHPQIQNQLMYTAITRFRNSLIYFRHKNKYINIPSIDDIYNRINK